MALGATPREWGHFDLALGLGANLLPCVPAASDVRVLPGSALEGKVGKIPSVYNDEGFAHGLTGWQAREILPDALAIWSRDSRYNVCVRTGPLSGVYALDVDVDDQELRDRIAVQILHALPPGDWSTRVRSNSPKFLLPFRVEGEWQKRIIKTTHGRIELLGTGQQFVACGTHSSGVRYEWEGGLPSQLPLLTPSEMDGLWGHLSRKFSISPTVDVGTPSKDRTSSDEDPVRTEMTDSEWDELISALRHILLGDYAATNDGWSEIGYALLSIQQTRPASQLWLDFSRKAAGYEPGKPEDWWAAHAHQLPRSDYRHIFSIARAQGWGKTVSAEAFTPVVVGSEAVGPVSVVDGGKLASLSLDPAPQVGRSTIKIIGGNLPLCINECMKLVKDELYHNAGILLRVEPPATMRAMPAGLLAERLTELAIWEKFDGRLKDWVAIDCPDTIADKFVKRSMWDLRRLEAIVQAPFIRPDGSICDVEGYDAATCAIYTPNAVFPAVPEAPTKDDARCALNLLLAPFDEFPFKNPESRSAFAAHLLTEAARLSMTCSPMFWYTAADPGVGKSLLADMPSTIVHGRAPSRRPWLRSEDELRKTLMASMLAGDRSMLFDNVPNGFKARAAELCAVITSADWQDRKLGVSEAPRVNNRMVISATGNNVTPVGDMARRSLVIRLVPPNGLDKGKRYKIADLREYVAEHRVELLIAALTIIRAHQLHGAGTYPVPLASFEQWSRRVRNPLLWLDVVDPVATQGDETDEETAGLARVFSIIGPMFSGREIDAPDIARAAGNSDALNDALLAANCDEPYSPRKIGYWLRENRDRIGGDWKLVQGKQTNQGRQWMIVPITVQTNEDLA